MALNRRVVALRAAFLYKTALLRCAENSKRSFGMYEDKEEYQVEDFEKLSEALLDVLFLVCEAHRRGQKDDYAKARPLAAMAVQESIRTFLALLKLQ